MSDITALNVVGRDIRRVDSLDKVTGRTKYAGDIKFPDMLHAKAVLSDYAHAKVLKIDTSEAIKMEGVVAILTEKDIPGAKKWGRYLSPDYPVIVAEGGEVNFMGDVLALVVATSRRIAEEAVKRVKVTYTVLPGVYSIEEALTEGAPLVQEGVVGNILTQHSLSKGDVDKGFAEADVIVDEVFRTPRQEHAYLEPEAAVALVDDEGRINIYTVVQVPDFVQRTVSAVTGLPQNKVRIIGTMAGGSFGGKAVKPIEPLVACAALKTGRPVSWECSREESFRFHPKRHPMRIRVRLGATREGKIMAMDVDLCSDVGPYATLASAVMTWAVNATPGPYKIANIRVIGKTVLTNNPISGAFRGFGKVQAATARECTIDILASRLGMNPIELRSKNFLSENDEPNIPGLVFDSPVTILEAVEKAIGVAGERPVPRGPHWRVGRGIGCEMPIFDTCGTPGFNDWTGASVAINMLQDGSLSVTSSASELGQGIRTVLSMMAAEVFGLSVGDVHVILADTDRTPKTGLTVASRQTYVSGNALLLAAKNLKKRLLDKASQVLEIEPESLIFKDGEIVSVDNPEKGMEIRQLAQICYRDGIKLREESWFKGTHAERGQTFQASLVDLEVNEVTGDVNVLKLICASDVGRVIMPGSLRGQFFGGCIQGMGYALSENLETREGIILKPSLAEYRIPTVLDVPETMEMVYIEELYPTGPFGAKGAGEHPGDSTVAAFLCAVYDAVGVMIKNFPATPEKILKVLGRFAEAEDNSANRA